MFSWARKRCQRLWYIFGNDALSGSSVIRFDWPTRIVMVTWSTWLPGWAWGNHRIEWSHPATIDNADFTPCRCRLFMSHARGRSRGSTTCPSNSQIRSLALWSRDFEFPPSNAIAARFPMTSHFFAAPALAPLRHLSCTYFQVLGSPR